MNLQEKIRDLARKLDQLYLITSPPDDEAIEKLITTLDAQSIAALTVTLDEDSAAVNRIVDSLV